MVEGNGGNESEEEGEGGEEEDIDIEQAVDEAFGLKQGVTRDKDKLSLVLGKNQFNLFLYFRMIFKE